MNDFSRTWHGREEELSQDAAASQRVVDARLTDDLQQAPVYAGESVGLVTEERSATGVVRALTAEAESFLKGAAKLLR